jgi:hypothetical protein
MNFLTYVWVWLLDVVYDNKKTCNCNFGWIIAFNDLIIIGLHLMHSIYHNILWNEPRNTCNLVTNPKHYFNWLDAQCSHMLTIIANLCFHFLLNQNSSILLILTSINDLKKKNLSKFIYLWIFSKWPKGNNSLIFVKLWDKEQAMKQ